MEEIEELHRFRDMWESLKESLPQKQQRILVEALKLPPGAPRDEQIAIAKAYALFQRDLAAKEQEAHAQPSRRSIRQPTPINNARKQRVTVLGFDRT